ncbi:hypothetical protein R8Z50_20020 [Longispora sp. K20-0274]|uniref:hypothetical protein n=1 Tax=Longispora sp. K20-0274 TaxID=3088255 RepID=UPI00399B93AF
MTGPVPRPLLFLDVDGPLIPFGGAPSRYPDGYPVFRTPAPSNPLLARVDPDARDERGVAARHPGRALAHRVDPRDGLTDRDYAAVEAWLGER